MHGKYKVVLMLDPFRFQHLAILTTKMWIFVVLKISSPNIKDTYSDSLLSCFTFKLKHTECIGLHVWYTICIGFFTDLC